MRADLRSVLFRFIPKAGRSDAATSDVIRGVNSRAIIVSSKLPPMFKEAVFILNDKYNSESEDVLDEAQRALSQYAQSVGLAPKKAKTSPVWPMLAAVLAAALILSLTGVI